MDIFLTGVCFLIGTIGLLASGIFLYVCWEKILYRTLGIVMMILFLGALIVSFLAGPEKTVTYTALIGSEPLTSVTEDKNGRVLFSKDASGQLGYTEKAVSRVIVLDDENATPRRDYFREKTIHYVNFLGRIFSRATYSEFYQYYVPRRYTETISEYNIPGLDWSDLFAVCG